MTPTRTASRMRDIAQRIMSSSRPSASAVAEELRRVLAAVSEEGPVQVKDGSTGQVWQVANPSDVAFARALWAFQFGESGTEHVLVWANSAEEALVVAADYLVESGKPGYFVPEDIMRQHYAEAREELGPDAEEEEVSQLAEQGLTYTEAGWIASQEWTVDQAGPELEKLGRAASESAGQDQIQQQA